MKTTKESAYFLAILLGLFLTAVAISYYRYMVLHEFQYFVTESDIPDRFEMSSYTSAL